MSIIDSIANAGKRVFKPKTQFGDDLVGVLSVLTVLSVSWIVLVMALAMFTGWPMMFFWFATAVVFAVALIWRTFRPGKIENVEKTTN